MKAVVPRVKSNTVPSSRTSSRRGRASGSMAVNAASPVAAMPSPIAAASTARTKLSVASCRVRRLRPAPSI